MHNESILPVRIDLSVPRGWHELDDRQLRYLYHLMAGNFGSDEIHTLCLLRWSGVKVIGCQPSGAYLLWQGKTLFEVSPLQLAELLSQLDWLTQVPSVPVRPSRLHRPLGRSRYALPADFSGVPFETFIVADNLYQGYLTTQDDALLDQLAAVLYGHSLRLRPWERVAVFFWLASLKEFFARRYPNFFQASDAEDGTDLLGTRQPSVEEAMNAQIRALTKGDVTKERDILALDTWRALTELDAQAREYQELNSQMKSHGK